MKKSFRTFGSFCFFALLAGLFFQSCGGADKIDDVNVIGENNLESRSHTCLVEVSGKILNTKNLEPIEGAIISSSRFSSETDEHGEFTFSVTLDEDGVIDEVTVDKEGFLLKEFNAYFGSLVKIGTCPLVRNVSWDISLSERKEGVLIGPREGAWFKVMDTVATRYITESGVEEIAQVPRLYSIDIRRGALDQYRMVHISPNASKASGPGLPIDVIDLLAANFEVEVTENGIPLPTAAQSRGIFKFLKPIEILFTLPTKAIGKNLESIDLDDLGIADQNFTSKNNGETLLLIDEDGSHAIGLTVLIENVIAPALTALQNGATLEEINAIIFEGLSDIGDEAGGETVVNSDVETIGQVIKTETYNTCDCNRRAYTFSASDASTPTIDIDFPASATPQERAEARADLLIVLSVPEENNETATVSADIDDTCTEHVVTSRRIIRTVEGLITGYPFTYVGVDRLDTNVEIGNCGTDTPCHQTPCPN